MNRSMNTAISIAAAGLSFVFAGQEAAAQQRPIETIDQTEMVRHLNTASIDGALGVVTGNHVVTVDDAGQQVISATATNGLQFEVRMTACAGSSPQDSETGADTRECKALYVISVWEQIPSDRTADFSGVAGGYLIDHPTMNAGTLPDGRPYVVRYVIADYGTMQGNLVSEFANFIRGATAFQNAIAPLYTE